MEGLIIMGIVIYMIYYFSYKKKPTYLNTPYSGQNNKQDSEKKAREKSTQSLKNINIQRTRTGNYNYGDPSIIDVTNQSYQIYHSTDLKKIQ